MLAVKVLKGDVISQQSETFLVVDINIFATSQLVLFSCVVRIDLSFLQGDKP
jgi:hypothetical protein